MSMRNFYIVTFSSGKSDDWCDLERCPMSLIGPFRSKEDAEKYTDAYLPEWAQPHYFEPTPGAKYTDSDDGRTVIMDLRIPVVKEES